jgi:hypothetical protein
MLLDSHCRPFAPALLRWAVRAPATPRAHDWRCADASLAAPRRCLSPQLVPELPYVDSSPSNGVVSRQPYIKRWGATWDSRYGDGGALLGSGRNGAAGAGCSTCLGPRACTAAPAPQQRPLPAGYYHLPRPQHALTPLTPHPSPSLIHPL